MDKEDAHDVAAKIEKHLDWVMRTANELRRRDIDDQFLTDDERTELIVLQLKLRQGVPSARKLAASLRGKL